MSDKRDISKFGNQKNLSIHHYLIKMFHRIIEGVDKNTQWEAFCVILSMVDWAQAFDRLSHNLGIQSALVPLMIKF